MNTAGLPSRTCLTLYPYLARYALPKNYYYNYLILYFLNFLWCEVCQPYLLIRDTRTMTFSTTIRRVTTLNCIYRSHLFATSMRSFLPTLKRRSLYLCLSSSEIPLINTVEPLLPGETGASTCMNEKNHLDWSYPHELLCSCSLSLCRDVLTWKYTGAGKVWTELLCSSKTEILGNENRLIVQMEN